MGQHIERRWLDIGSGSGRLVDVVVWDSDEPVRVQEHARPLGSTTPSEGTLRSHDPGILSDPT